MIAPWGVAAERGVDLSGLVALVTGGAAGIGEGCVRELARCGAAVVIADIDSETALATAESVEREGHKCVAADCDVMDAEQIRGAVERAVGEFGRLDILVNNAGGTRSRAFLDQSEKSWRRHIELNLASVLAATSAAATLMVDKGRGGSIVNVVSIEATRAAPGYAVYAACKAAVASFTRTMAVELAEHGIRVNAIAPDVIRTPGLGAADAVSVRRAAGYIPLGREGSIEDCGSVVAFLCSSLASYVTGATIPVDGGTWASSGWIRGPAGGWTLF